MKIENTDTVKMYSPEYVSKVAQENKKAEAENAAQAKSAYDDIDISKEGKSLLDTGKEKAERFRQQVHFCTFGDIKEIPAEYRIENLFKMDLKADSIFGGENLFQRNSTSQYKVFDEWLDNNASGISEEQMQMIKDEIKNATGAMDSLRRVFSIWICMGTGENCMDYIHLSDDKLIGAYPWKGRPDLLNIVLIGIANELPEHDDKYELHRLLGALLSKQLTSDEKLNIMETEYDIPAEDNLRKDVKVMCNLSQGIEENGIAMGETRFILSMHKKGYTLEQIADVAGKSIEEVQAIIERKEPVMA